jgi:hypothetical protein
MKHLKTTGSLEGTENAVIPFMQRQQFVDYPRYVEMDKKYKGA